MNKFKFGTAGIRDKNLTLHDIQQIACGYAQYLNFKYSDRPNIYIGYDTREFSEYFAFEIAKCLRAYNINSYVFDRTISTPLLSYVISKYGDGGIMVTASHNSKEYHGLKLYNEYGKQLLEEDTKIVETIINSNPEIKFTSSVNAIFVNKYINEYFNNLFKRCNFYKLNKSIKIIYTPLDGSGLEFAKKLFEMQYLKYNLVKSECNKKLNISIPNPQLVENYKEALSYANNYKADIIFATDCDSDRIGCMVKDKDQYKLLSGNEIGIILTYFLTELNIKGNIITTDVSTLLVDKINKNIIRVPVGFKNIANKINDDFLFAFEDTNGILIRNYTFDKDATAGMYIILQAASYFKDKYNENLIEVLNKIYKKYGISIDKCISIKHQFKSLYKSFNIGRNCKITIRTSGTEPLLKIYINKIKSS